MFDGSHARQSPGQIFLTAFRKVGLKAAETRDRAKRGRGGLNAPVNPSSREAVWFLTVAPYNLGPTIRCLQRRTLGHGPRRQWGEAGRARFHAGRASPCREVTPMHKYAAPTALAIALNITMLALTVSASLTPANGADFSSAHPSRASIWPSGEAMRDKYGIARRGGRSTTCAGALGCVCRVQQCGDIPVGKPSPAIAACMEKCVKAKEAAQH